MYYRYISKDHLGLGTGLSSRFKSSLSGLEMIYYQSQIMELPVVRRTQPITIGQKQPMSNCYNSYMVNHNNT